MSTPEGTIISSDEGTIISSDEGTIISSDEGTIISNVVSRKDKPGNHVPYLWRKARQKHDIFRIFRILGGLKHLFGKSGHGLLLQGSGP